MEIYVIGYASHPPAEKVLAKRLEEMAYDTSAQALRAASVERSELDHITLAACDELDGRSISNMLMVAPAGGYLKDELRVADSGMVGLHLAAMRIASGRYSLGLLASWNKTSKAPFEDVMRMRCEPFFTRPIGLNAAIADALFAQAQCDAGTARRIRGAESSCRAYGETSKSKDGDGPRRKDVAARKGRKEGSNGCPLLSHPPASTKGKWSAPPSGACLCPRREILLDRRPRDGCRRVMLELLRIGMKVMPGISARYPDFAARREFRRLIEAGRV